MIMRAFVLAVMFGTVGPFAGQAFAQQPAHDEKAEKHEEHGNSGKVTGETLENLKVTLGQGLAASEKTGKDGHPIAEVTVGMEDDLKVVTVKLD